MRYFTNLAQTCFTERLLYEDVYNILSDGVVYIPELVVQENLTFGREFYWDGVFRIKELNIKFEILISWNLL